MAAQELPPAPAQAPIQTRVLKVPAPASPTAGGVFRPNPTRLGHGSSWSHLDNYDVSTCPEAFLAPLREAATYLQRGRRNGGEGRATTNGDGGDGPSPATTTAPPPPPLPVAFPTETVYGLGADATRSDAVRAIYAAKGRPSDNPLIVHVCDLEMLRGLLRPHKTGQEGKRQDSVDGGGREEQEDDDPIPAIYRPLIKRFWPGPLTILLPLPPPDASHPPPLAPEVTAGLPTFGARMPASPLALSLIRLAGVPLAAPSANASTRPSPTTARHVVDDLAGRVELVLDGGACGVGVESTVVDGLARDGGPPVVLRPGGVGIDELRGVPGWEGTVVAYADAAMRAGAGVPRAPGMKYKHYSPRARVVLFEASRVGDVETEVRECVDGFLRGGQPQGVNGSGERLRTVGFIRTGGWRFGAGLELRGVSLLDRRDETEDDSGGTKSGDEKTTTTTIFEGSIYDLDEHQVKARMLDVDLGTQVRGIAQGLFAALRDLDTLGADIILVEGIADDQDIAAAVMNRLRKAASEIKA